MKTTRRQFLKSLIATAATAAIAPQVLVESVHGASDLSAHERDAVANAMGLRSKQWQGADLWHPKTMRRTTWPDGARMTDRIDDWDIKHGNLIMFPDAKTELFIEGAGWQEVLTVRAQERDRQILWGRPGGQMPVGVLGADEIDEIWKHSDEERPAMLYGHPVETGTFRQSIDGLRFEPEHKHSGGYHQGGYLVPPDATRKIVKQLTLGPELISRTENERAYRKASIATWNEYDPEPDAIHINFGETWEVTWQSRELKPDPDQKSPFVRLR